MQLGLIGLGRMGGNMARRLLAGGHQIVAWDRNPDAVRALAADGASAAASMDDLIQQLTAPRAVWMMVPAGDPTEQIVVALADRLRAGDVVIDGGNTYFKDDIRRSSALGDKSVHYVDVGTSGGVWGAERGYCLMIGGPADVVARLGPIFRTLAPGTAAVAPTPHLDVATTTAHEGFLHCGPAGAGHFVKMVHNGIEYGLMQSYAEGFDLLRNAASESVAAERRYELDVAAIAELWRRGSVVSSWLLDLAAAALAKDPALEQFTGRVADSGEGRWTVMTALEEEVSADVLTTAVYARFRSRRDHTFGEKLLSALRAQFGGHVEPPR